jgi:hypothetical protein
MDSLEVKRLEAIEARYEARKAKMRAYSAKRYAEEKEALRALRHERLRQAEVALAKSMLAREGA